jgi:hypothetical protein
MENRNSRSALTRTPFELTATPVLVLPIIFRESASRMSHERKRTFSNWVGHKFKFHRCPICNFAISLFSLFLLAGCGAPGDPVAPSPPIPTAIADLSARQAGDAVQLTFSMPTKTIRGERLTETPAIEVLRGAARPDGSPDPPSFRIVDTLPGAIVGKFQADDHIQFVSAVAPDVTRAHPGATIVYRVRTRASKKRASLDSNAVAVRVFPVPERAAPIQSKVTETSIDLRWPAVAGSSGGDPITLSEYHVYRGELDPRAHDSATKDVLHEKWIAPLALLAHPDTPEYRDTQFDFGKIYVYIVRSVTIAEGNPLESSDSDPLEVTPVDTFPPATPQGVVAAFIENPNAGSTPAVEVDLSWSINAEPDLAGYRVYRSEQQDDKAQLVTPDLLLSPAYRDTSVSGGHPFWYRVTAVDRSGNESAPSPPVAADVTQHSL